MKHIPEKLLHFIWKNQLFERKGLKTTSGETIVIEHPGEHHSDAGPDFFNARIRIDKTHWAGNIEIHVNASDGIKHGHQKDKAYDNVILHVVHFYDCEITDSCNNIIPALVLPCPDKLINTYEDLISSEKWIACQDQIQSIPPVYINQWISSLMIERLHEKHLRMKAILDKTKNDWEQMLFVALLSCFGIPLNQLPFEMLAASVDIRNILRIKEDLFKTEAMLFGAAGFLTANLPSDYYSESLLKEYRALKLRIDKEEIPYHLWKFLRLRPGSFPSLRLALLASLIHFKFPLTEAIAKVKTKKDLYNILRTRASDYWNTHYLFGKTSPSRIKYTGKTFLDILIINAIIPYLFTLGKLRDHADKIELAIKILEEVSVEKNETIKNWRKFGVNAKNAFESQALIQLYNMYCKQRRCLNCQIGIKIIAPLPHEG